MPDVYKRVDCNVSYEMVIDSTLETDHTSSGIKGYFQNGTASTVHFGDVAYVATDGQLELADSDDGADEMPAVGMVLEDITTLASGYYLMYGIVRDDTWNWTIGGEIYVKALSASGSTMTQTKPAVSGDRIQIVGIALSADTMFFNPSYEMETV